jgi:hypothetical protein
VDLSGVDLFNVNLRGVVLDPAQQRFALESGAIVNQVIKVKSSDDDEGDYYEPPKRKMGSLHRLLNEIVKNEEKSQSKSRTHTS